MTSWAVTSTAASSTSSRQKAAEFGTTGPGPRGSGPSSFLATGTRDGRGTVGRMGRAGRLGAIYGLFLVSGAAGLIYEVVWARLLKEVFGVTAYAVATVLAAYLGGLALGAWLLGSRVDRQTHPLRFYGFLELGIAATALFGALLLRFLEPLHDAAAIRLSPGSPMLLLIRVLLASLVVLPPTFLMGGTLPAVTRAVVADLRNVGRDLSLLYALNTGGAVAGTLVAGFVLIRAPGVHPTWAPAPAGNSPVR